MNTAPVEPSRRSRREAREAQLGASVREQPAEGEEAPAVERPVSPQGRWMPLAIAGVAVVVGLVVGLLVTVAFDGAAGRSLGGVVASVVVGATGLALLPRCRPAGYFELRALDVLWAVVLGIILPFIAGVFAGGGGWPAFAALSPRWLLLGVVAPFVSLLLLTIFATGLVYALVRRAASTVPVWNRVFAAAASAIAFAIIPLVFRADVSGMPVALPVILGVASAVFVALSQRLWGPLVMTLVFTGVWVAMSAVGYVLA